MRTEQHHGAPRAARWRSPLAVLAAAGLLCGAATAGATEPTEVKTTADVLATEADDLRATGLLDLEAPRQATILTPEDFERAQTESALVRLDNHKITFMTKDAAGQPQEFVSMATETGFWDTRACGGVYEERADKLFSCVTSPESPFYQDGDEEAGMREAFRQMKEDYGFNTVQITVNWAEWDKTVDPASPTFDYTVLDELQEWAGDAGLKVFWVLFFHVQTNMPDYNSMGVYNIADEEGYSYGIQWGSNLTEVADYPKDADSAVPELYPEYWHPVVHDQIQLALGDLARHYADSDTVIGYQVGNEEGPTGPYNDGQDANPYYQAMFELWKEETGGSDLATFRKELGLAVWQSMVGAIRDVDPYKAVTTNFQSSDVDKYPTGNTAGGQDLDFYRDAGLDLIAPMYYGDTAMIRGNVDTYYGSSDSGTSTVAQELPALFPSEIGIGYERGPVTQSDILDTLARGGIGFGLYAFGEMEALAPNMQGLVRNILAMTTEFESELWSGQPVSAHSTRNIHMTTSDANMTLTTLETIDPDTALGLLWRDYHTEAGATLARPVSVSVKTAGTYTVEAMVDGTTVDSKTAAVAAGEAIEFDSITMDEVGSAFIKVTRIS